MASGTAPPAPPAPPAATPSGVTTRNTARQKVATDKIRLAFALISTLQIEGDVDPPSVDPAVYSANPVTAALASDGIECWSDFLTLGTDGMETLVVPNDGTNIAYDLPNC